MQQFVEVRVRRLQVEEELADLALAQLVGGLHLVQAAQPLLHLQLGVEVLGNEGQAIHVVSQVFDVRL